MAITFTKSTRTYDGTTGQSTVSTASVSGVAVQVRGDPKEYEALGLRVHEAPTLLFVPTTYGDEPEIGSRVTWNGSEHVVKSVSVTAPDGVVIMARVIVQRETSA